MTGLGPKKNLPMYFVLACREQNGLKVSYPKESLPEHGEVLKLIEKVTLFEFTEKLLNTLFTSFFTQMFLDSFNV